LAEEEVRSYLLHLRERGAALGTFKPHHGGIQFLFCRTLEREWSLFSKKESIHLSDGPSRELVFDQAARFFRVIAKDRRALVIAATLLSPGRGCRDGLKPPP
jgi:hypothetical protein